MGDNNNITFNNAINNTGDGIRIYHLSDYCYILNNTAVNNTGDGFSMASTCTNDMIANNTLSNNYDNGILIETTCTDITITKNEIHNNTANGVYVYQACDNDILVTPTGGYSGYISYFRYLTYAVNPTQAYNIYKEGYGGSSLGGLLDKYRVKIAFLEDNKEVNSFEL